jgi:hypothetical protein
MLLIRRSWLSREPWRVDQNFHHFEDEGTGASYDTNDAAHPGEILYE